jgi:hypothetical protein
LLRLWYFLRKAHSSSENLPSIFFMTFWSEMRLPWVGSLLK